MLLAQERKVAIEAVLQGSRICQAVFKKLVNSETLTKKDNSPVTVADYSVQAIVNNTLSEAFPNDPIVGEEDSKDLRVPEGAVLKQKVVDLCNESFGKVADEEKWLQAIDRGVYGGGSKGRHWTLDPIDGTKGFLRGEQFAVCLALIEDGQIKLGVMGCPNLPVDASKADGERGCLFVAVKGQGAFQRTFDDPTERPIHVSQVTDPALANFCESVEAGHSSHDDSGKVASALNITLAPVRMDSQAKYASIARGDASIYLRLPTIKGYEEKIWDHASGWLIVHEAGGKVTDIHGKELDFSVGRTLKNNSGVVATNGKIHDQVISAIASVVKPSH